MNAAPLDLCRSLTRNRIAIALMALALGLAVFAAGSILETERGAAQKIEESPGVVRSSSAPTVTASAEYPNAQVSWQYDAAANSIAGWNLISFQVWRRGDVDDVEFGSFDNDPDSEIFPVQGTSTRSYTDSLSHKTQANWIDGFKVRYFVRAAFQRASDGLVQHGQQGQFFLAVQPPASRLAVLNADGATVAATAQYPGALISWSLDAAAVTPRGWRLVTFKVARYSTQLGTVDQRFLDQHEDARSFTDPLSAVTSSQWIAGFKYLYGVTPVYQRIIGGTLVDGKQSVALLTVEATTTPLDVVTNYPAPTLTAVAHSDGVQLTWQFDEEASTPPGWKLAGFQLTRWKETKAGNLLRGSRVWFNAPYPSPTDRSLKDPLTGTTMEERLPGGKFFYAINAFYDRLVDDAQQVGKRTKLVFTAPKLPNARNFTISDASQNYRPPLHTLVASWSDPHVNWDATAGFDNVSSYTVYQHGNEIRHERSIGSYVGYPTNDGSYSFDFNVQLRCSFGFQIRAHYGLFYSDLAGYKNNRSGC